MSEWPLFLFGALILPVGISQSQSIFLLHYPFELKCADCKSDALQTSEYVFCKMHVVSYTIMSEHAYIIRKIPLPECHHRAVVRSTLIVSWLYLGLSSGLQSLRIFLLSLSKRYAES